MDLAPLKTHTIEYLNFSHTEILNVLKHSQNLKNQESGR